MPFVKIYLRKGKSPEYLHELSDAVHQALVAQANVPADDLFQVIHQLDPGCMVAHPTYGGVNRSDDLIIIQITLNVGRTLEIKKSLYADIAARLGKAIDVRPDDVMVSLVEVAKENWSFGGGRATYA
jgi:phenylpyruvate tautomerase PptA (4-oxalocrotonate tautomerase family)